MLAELPQHRREIRNTGLDLKGRYQVPARAPEEITESQSSRKCDGFSEKLRPTHDLEAGDIHWIRWEDDGQWYTGVLLPLGDFEGIGMCGTIDDITRNFRGDLPSYYKYKNTEIVKWEDSYENDGLLFNNRKYPIFYLDSVSIPPLANIMRVTEHKIMGGCYRVESQSLAHARPHNPGKIPLFSFHSVPAGSKRPRGCDIYTFSIYILT